MRVLARVLELNDRRARRNASAAQDQVELVAPDADAGEGPLTSLGGGRLAGAKRGGGDQQRAGQRSLHATRE